jgi:hypothetical protein
MFLNNMLSSLHSAAFAMTLTAALPALAQGATGPNTLQTHGSAAGDWVPATASMPGSMQGLMVDTSGAPRFEIFAITHVTLPAVVSGYDTGTMYGRLMSPRLEGDAQDPKNPEGPVEIARNPGTHAATSPSQTGSVTSGLVLRRQTGARLVTRVTCEQRRSRSEGAVACAQDLARTLRTASGFPLLR